MDVFPDFGGVGAADDLRVVIGALLMFVLIIVVDREMDQARMPQSCRIAEPPVA